ncbi:hypothetical protein ACS127_17285 [Amphibacillus sp. Q70]|uniref:hypothetical protein n=1 Tax=Amphibacillus sp. Q70 TaxID=3453416 RepID=UPI003F837878
MVDKNDLKKDGRSYCLQQIELLYEKSKITIITDELAKLSEAMAHLYRELNNF